MVHHNNESSLDFLADEIKKLIDGYEERMFKQEGAQKKKYWQMAIHTSNHILDLISIIQEGRKEMMRPSRDPL